VTEALTDARPRAPADCVRWARLRFEDMFANRIKQLMHNYPIDRLTATGTLFWSGAKKVRARMTHAQLGMCYVIYPVAIPWW